MTSTQTTPSRPTMKRIGNRHTLGLAALGAAILGHFGSAARAAREAVSGDSTTSNAPRIRPHTPGFGAAPDIWGQSAACRRMVFKNRRARR
jgi:hypothetical protein